jgi:hypothetical protein
MMQDPEVDEKEHRLGVSPLLIMVVLGLLILIAIMQAYILHMVSQKTPSTQIIRQRGGNKTMLEKEGR